MIYVSAPPLVSEKMLEIDARLRRHFGSPPDRAKVDALGGLEGVEVQPDRVVISLGELGRIFTEGGERTQDLLYEAGELAHELGGGNPGEERLAILRQLRDMGVNVSVRDPDIRGVDPFIARAKQEGVRIEDAKFDKGMPDIGIELRYAFARDLWTNLSTEAVQALQTPYAAESLGIDPVGMGGNVVPVTDGTAMIAETIRDAETIRRLEKKGYIFYPMKPGLVKHPYLTALLDRDTYEQQPHPDLFTNAVPAKRVVVADPHYRQRNQETYDRLPRETKSKLIIINESEAHLLAANFLNSRFFRH